MAHGVLPRARVPGGLRREVVGRCVHENGEPAQILVREEHGPVVVRLAVGSRFDIYRALRTRTNEGTAMLVKSSDPIELAGLCDRVLVMSRGQIIEEIPGDELDELRIVEAMVRGPGLSRAGRSPLGVAMPRGPSSNGAT